MIRTFQVAIVRLTVLVVGCVSVVSQIVPLPSTVFGCTAASGRLLASSPGALLISDSGSLTLRRISYPPGVWQAQNVRGTMLPLLSRSGRYVYQAFNGADGLYRYDLSTETWSVIRPPSASHAISALCVTQDDRIVIGCGGYVGNTSSDARDLFVSSDFGSTWDTLGLPMEEKLNKSGILTIVESGGSIVIRTKQFQGTAFSGIFERRNAEWKRLYSGNTDELLSVGASSYFSTSTGLFEFQSGQSASPLHLPNIGSVSWIQRWSDDTVIARTKLPGQDTVSFVLINDASIVRTMLSVHIPARYQSVAVLPWEGVPSMAYIRDGISAIISPETGVLLPVTIDPSAPAIASMTEDSGKLWCIESSHGLYQVDTSISIRRISDVNTGNLNYATPKFTVQGTYWQLGSAIVQIGVDGVDTLLIPSAFGLGVVDAMEYMEDGTLLVAADNKLSLVNLVTESVTPFTMNGWPKYTQNDVEWYCGVGCIARFGSKLYAFATRPARIAVGDESVGGLFRLEGETWSRCDDSRFGISTAIQTWRRTSASLVISSVSGMSGSTFIGGKLVRYDVVDGAATLIADDELATYGGVVDVAANDSLVLWTSDNSLWVQRNASAAERISGLPPVGAASIVGSYVFLWFRDSSVVRIPLTHFISSTSVSSNDIHSQPFLHAIPSVVSNGDDVQLSLGGRMLYPSSMELVSMDGVVQPVLAVPSVDGSTFTFQVPHVASGLYIVVLEDGATGYRVSAKLLVR